MSGALAGKSVLVTRPKGQSEDLVRSLEGHGATAILMPAIEIAPPADFAPLDGALKLLMGYDWVIFTSANGVDAVLNRMGELSIGLDHLASRKLAVIGPATAAALTNGCREPDVMPREFVSEAILEVLGHVFGRRILLPRADIARRDIAVELHARGAKVTEVAAYRIVPTPDLGVDWDRRPDYITVTSSASAIATIERLKANGKESWTREVPIVCIGPITEATVRGAGYPVAAVAPEYTANGLVAALLELSAGEHQHV